MSQTKTFLDLSYHGDIRCIPESKYTDSMQQIILPYLEERKKSGYFNSSDKIRLYYETYLQKDAIGSIVISHGFIESIYKYKEVIYYFLQAGYNVFGLDHRGHGKSYRHVKDKYLIYVENFNDYVSDLNAFITQIVIPASKEKPLHLYAHSMGGAIGALYLEQYPDTFQKAVLTSPMMQIHTHGVPLPLTKAITGFYNAIGQGSHYIFTQKKYPPFDCFENSPSTSRARYEYYMEQCDANEVLQTSAGSFKWMKEALHGIKNLLLPENLEKIKTPVLLFKSENDSFVLPDGYDTFVSHAKQVCFLDTKGTKHEIFFSENKVLEPYINTIVDFYK